MFIEIDGDFYNTNYIFNLVQYESTFDDDEGDINTYVKHWGIRITFFPHGSFSRHFDFTDEVEFRREWQRITKILTQGQT